jgi:DNA-binding MarR family transcriptional regulator
LERSRAMTILAPQPPLADEPDLAGFSLRDQPGHLLRLCQQRAVELFVREVGEDGPTPQQFAILSAVAQCPGLSQTDLARRTGIDRSTLTEILKRMVARGWVARERSVADQRTNLLVLSDDGHDVLKSALPAMLRAQERILAPLPKGRRAEAVEILRTLAESGETGEG